MSAARGIFSLVMLGFFIWLTVWSYQRYVDGQERLQVAQHEYDVAAAEAEQAQKEFDNVIKYGCATPVVSPGLVSCPNG